MMKGILLSGIWMMALCIGCAQANASRILPEQAEVQKTAVKTQIPLIPDTEEIEQDNTYKNANESLDRRYAIKLLKIIKLNSQQITEAQNLIYRVYIEEQKRDLPLHDSSHQRVITTPYGKIIADDYDASSVWLGAINHSNELVSCLRLNKRHPLTNRLKIEHYMDQIPEQIAGNENIYELGRGVVDSRYRYKGLLLLKMFKTAFELYSNKPVSFIGFSELSNVRTILLKYVLMDDMNIDVTYDAGFKLPTRVYILPAQRVNESINILSKRIVEIESEAYFPVSYKSGILSKVKSAL